LQIDGMFLKQSDKAGGLTVRRMAPWIGPKRAVNMCGQASLGRNLNWGGQLIDCETRADAARAGGRCGPRPGGGNVNARRRLAGGRFAGFSSGGEIARPRNRGGAAVGWGRCAGVIVFKNFFFFFSCGRAAPRISDSVRRMEFEVRSALLDAGGAATTATQDTDCCEPHERKSGLAGMG